MRQSIFGFLKETPYAPCFSYLETFEKKFLLDPKEAGNSLRNFLELFTDHVIVQTGMKDAYTNSLKDNNNDSLSSRLYFMRKNPNIYKNHPIQMEYRYFVKGKPEQRASRFLPDYKYPYNKLFILDFFRGYANQFHHDPEQIKRFPDPDYDVNFYHTLDYISLLQEYLLDFLGMSSKNQVDFRKMPLSLNNGQTVFYMESELMTAMDPSLLHCRYSFSGTMYPNKDKDEAYFAIIQLFDKNDPALPLEQLERCATTYAATRRSKFGEALRDIRVLSGYHGNAEFYILAYIFEEPAQPLTEQLLQSISKADRLVLCREIAGILAALHNADPAIYHRFLNHNCIYLCNNIESDILWYPSITGFSLAKINRENQPTVLLKDSKDRITRQIPPNLTPYIPLGWADSVNDCGDTVDIYSMGMLFFHILTGKFNHNIHVNSNNLINKYFPTIRMALTKELSDATALIIDMLNPLGTERPSAKEVFERLDKLCK